MADIEKWLEQAGSPQDTPFDYIVIGSGAGGGTLAARLAESGRTVLLLEAGSDPAYPADQQQVHTSEPREVYAVPGYHAAATEDKQMSWGFSVRHYESLDRQGADSKYNAKYDPESRSQPGKGGIFYPRSTGLGGCTGHFAMIVVKPNDHDWNYIADLTGDRSWSAARMQGYFGKLEDCHYYTSYGGFLRKILRFYIWWMKLVKFINPRWVLDSGGHGFKGWQKTNFIDPELILNIAGDDRTFRKVLLDALLFLLTRTGQLRALLWSLLRLQLVQFLDPNFGVSREDRGGRAAFIPIATNGNQRFSLRERLIAVAEDHPDRLVILKQALATRLIFRKDPNEPRVPRAVGVEVERGPNLYEASPLHAAATASAGTLQVFARHEIVVAGGAFNTPQLLMLSGIGEASHLHSLGIEGPRDLSNQPIAPVINLPGVGRNLQDRYEVSVISRAAQPFTTLNTVSFDPGDNNDEALRKWRQGSGGLYAINGGALAFFYKTKYAQQAQPDLFIFGAPAAFRGYYWGWSKELLCASIGAQQQRRDLWSWILLKAYTSNDGGFVRLRTASPHQQPEINFASFSGPQAEQDLQAVIEGVGFIRKLNKRIKLFAQELQPTEKPPGGDLGTWIKKEAWGHHACGTCRMGSDPWRADCQLDDRRAVVDSNLRVHGVRGLRIADTSVFPRIPGYFIVTPTFMVGEKCADMLLQDSANYPSKLETAEALAIRRRRARALRTEETTPGPQRLPQDTVGLAFSGGGVRSATFCLGVLQALAKRSVLRRIDMISSVSGGGYISAFLGRLFTRQWPQGVNVAERVERILASNASPEIWWLRTHARYLTGAGRTDLESDIGTIWRNLLSVQISIALVLLAGALALCALAVDWPRPQIPVAGLLAAVQWSAWWWAPFAVVLLGLLPAWIGFWLAPKPGAKAALSLGGLSLWLLALLGAMLLLRSDAGFAAAVAAILVLLLSWVWQEAALWLVPAAESERARGAIARNRLTRAAGITLALLGATVLWVLLDTFAEYTASHRPGISTGLMALVAGSLPMLRSLATKLIQGKPKAAAQPKNDAKESQLQRTGLFALIAFPLVILLAFGLDVVAHWIFQQTSFGIELLVTTLVISLAIGRATGFVNLSSLQSLYAARLARTYLGAANDERMKAPESSPLQDVDSAHPGDDVFLYDYHPEKQGGPLHLINVCINETVDVSSGRQLAEDKGLPMCLGPEGVSVGARFHALWEQLPTSPSITQQFGLAPENPDEKRSSLTAVPTGPAPEAFHVLASRSHPNTPVPVEALRLSEWMAISGAAASPGFGRQTTLPLALLLGLFNVRLGYWWNTHIRAGDRPGHFPPSVWRRLKDIPGTLFRTQALILNEWRGYFAGPWQKLWYLTDGGHSENTGIYELIRRRVHLIIAVDAEQDEDYSFDDLGLLVRRARLDFGANIQWIDPTIEHELGGWEAVAHAANLGDVSPVLQELVNPASLGNIEAIKHHGTSATALARIDYDDGAPSSWLLVLKSCLSAPPPIPLDVQCYARDNDAFPNQSTLDQFFNDDQWESYRLLGESLMATVLKQPVI
ncbi:MAG TPA: GMC oxidoreductase [Steroidobacteraceae bacterium]|nr:GMC oxidoreductase [Steroidobacteraceae bacterium]